MKPGLSILVMSIMIGMSAIAEPYTGHVFLDKNGNHKYDKGEKVLAGVAVSDGLNVVKTDNDGVYTLTGYADARFIFITMPSGYRGETYYHRIQLDADCYDFELQYADPLSVSKDGAHRFVHISDTHMFDSYRTALDGYAFSMKNLRNYVNNEHIAFVIHTGDIAREGFGAYRDFLNNRNAPASQIYYAIGNHDLGSYKGEGTAYGEELFERHFGPAYYSFDVGNIHYIVTPMWRGDGKPTYTNESIGRWLKNDLKNVPPDKPVIAFNHGTMSADGHFRFGSEEEGFIDIADHNLKAWIYGHWHHNSIYYHKGSRVKMICSPGQARGSYDRSPSSYRVLTADRDGNLDSEIRYSYINPSVAIASIDNGAAPLDADGNVVLSVNAYSSVSPTVAVTARCVSNGKEVVKSIPLRRETDFSWNTHFALPESLDNQTVRVEVMARFANGETRSEQTVFDYHVYEKPKVKLGMDWTNLLQNTKHVPKITDTLRLPLRPVWIANVGANIYFTSPLVYDGAVYVASMDDNAKGRASISCIDARDGTILWKYPLHNTVRSSIAITDGCVLAQDVNGVLYSVDAGSGKLVWEKDLGINKQEALDNGIIAADGVVYAGAGRFFAAYEARSGEKLWGKGGWDVCHQATPVLGDGILLPMDAGYYALDAKTGKPLWTGRGFDMTGGTPAMHGNVAYYVSRNSIFLSDLTTGNCILKKKYDFDMRSLSVPLVTDDVIVFGTPERGLVAVDNKTFEEKWNFCTGEALVYTVPTIGGPSSPVETSPVLSGDIVYFGASDGCLYGLDRKSGELKWQHKTGAPVLGSMAISGNMLFAVDFSGNVYAFASCE